ncbi:hypothetical protein [Actinomadura oligospora]|uniref:hypothetical protein n=1 Tax=Actinomadura oligospora TaxID=111804 RepID=UPI000479562E|nr:hypothetical protein [Actinomadura oligospora]
MTFDVGAALLLIARWDEAADGPSGDDEYEAAVDMRDFIAGEAEAHTVKTSEDPTLEQSDWDAYFREQTRRVDAAMTGQVTRWATQYAELGAERDALTGDEVEREYEDLADRALLIVRQLGEALGLIPEDMPLL